MIVAALVCFFVLVLAWLAAPATGETAVEPRVEVQLSESPA